MPAIPDILEEFTHRQWHSAVTCSWDGANLKFSATNDYDADGLALLDEFWDAVHACVNYAGTVRFSVLQIDQVTHDL